MIPELIRQALPAKALLLVVGLLPEDLDGLGGQVVDLDAIDPGTALDDPRAGSVALIARTVTDLRRAASLSALLPKAARHVVAVTASAQNGTFPLPMTPPDKPLQSFQAERGQGGEWVVSAAYNGPAPLGELVAALTRTRPVPGPRVALAGPGAAHWRPGDPGATPTTRTGPVGDPDLPATADVVLRVAATEPWTDARVQVVDRPAATLGSDAVPPVDERSVNPIGFVSDPSLGEATLTRTGGRWSIAVEPDSVVRFHPSGAVTEGDVARLRRLRSVAVEDSPGADPVTAARVVAGLAAAGVPLRAARTPAWAAALGSELTGLLTGVAAGDLADDLLREEHSVRLRRAAMRGHSTEARWRNLAAAAGLPAPPAPSVSVVLCTRRPEFLGFALRQIAGQRDVDLELILTLHGIPADLPEVKAAITGFDRPITVVEVSPETGFGAALNQGIAHASGRYVAKWDDDDWYSSGFLADMLLASRYSGAELVGCHAQFVYLGQIDLTIYRTARTEWTGRWISGGTFVLHRSALDTVGGFPQVRRHVDAALVDQLLAAGARIYRTHSLGYALHRRATGHTWDQPVTYFLRSAARQWRGRRFSSFIDPVAPPTEDLD